LLIRSFATMEIGPDTSGPGAASAYRQVYGGSLMTLRKLRGAIPTLHEVFRIRSVETLAPTLWVTVTFLDGSTKSFRPEAIRPATEDEERALALKETANSSL
jgi:hypothetical protein